MNTPQNQRLLSLVMILSVKNEELDFYKNKLKELGAYKFSKVKIDENTTNLCFSAEKIPEYKKMLKTV